MTSPPIEQLNSSHKKAEFKCGVDLLDTYLHKQAKQDVKKRLSACFILPELDTKLVKGYYTLSNSSVKHEDLISVGIKGLPPAYKDIPVTLLGRLAIDERYRKQGFGELLLIDALKKSYDTSNQIGSLAVVVDPIDENAESFYRKYGFIKLEDSGKMFLPMNSIAQLFG